MSFADWCNAGRRLKHWNRLYTDRTGNTGRRTRGSYRHLFQNQDKAEFFFGEKVTRKRYAYSRSIFFRISCLSRRPFTSKRRAHAHSPSELLLQYLCDFQEQLTFLGTIQFFQCVWAQQTAQQMPHWSQLVSSEGEVFCWNKIFQEQLKMAWRTDYSRTWKCQPTRLFLHSVEDFVRFYFRESEMNSGSNHWMMPFPFNVWTVNYFDSYCNS